MSVDTYALTTISGVKAFIGLTTTSDDSLLEDLVDSVSALFETYCDRNFLSREYTEYYDGNNITELFTNQYSITTISGIWDNSDWDWSDSDLIDSDSYRISSDSKYIVFRDTYLLDYQQNVKVIYTAGYNSTPYDLEQACIEEVARLYKNKNQIDISSKSLPDGSVSYVVTDFLPKTLTILNKYRKIRIY